MRPRTLSDIDADLARAAAAGSWADAERIGAQADRMAVTAEAAFICHGAALWYAQQGLRVFPLRPGSKIPWSGSSGCRDATTDTSRINTWWSAQPDANVAIATGHIVDVIDIDGPLGVRSCLDCPDLPDPIGIASTPRPGGTHLFIPATGQGNRAGILPGVDFRGLGGYVVASPSLLAPAADRDYHGRYRWQRPLNLQPKR